VTTWVDIGRGWQGDKTPCRLHAKLIPGWQGCQAEKREARCYDLAPENARDSYLEAETPLASLAT